jgi:hypothetical protein
MVVPVYNSEDILRKLIARLDSALRESTGVHGDSDTRLLLLASGEHTGILPRGRG